MTATITSENVNLYIYICCGALTGFVVFIVVVIVLVKCCFKKKRRKSKKKVILVPPPGMQQPEKQVISDNIEANNPTKAKVTQIGPLPRPPPSSSTLDKNVKTAKKPLLTTQMLPSDSTQPSLSLDITQPKTESEMTPDELEYLAFCTIDAGKRFRLFNIAVKMSEKIAEAHGFWINDRDPTVPGDEEMWLQKEADNMVRACVEIHGVPVPDFGANKSEYMDFIERHSLREIYQIALYTEVNDVIRSFFLTAVIDRFREVVRKLSSEQLEKCQHPIPLLLRIYKEHPDVFEFKLKKHEKSRKRR